MRLPATLAPRERLLGPGDAKSLQTVNTSEMPDGAQCWVIDQKAYYHFHREDNTTPANYPSVMVPGSGPGRWLNSDHFFGATGDANNGWRDMIGQITTPSTEIGNPTREPVGDSDFTAYKFDLDEHVWIEYHINHDYRPGTPMYVHVHWLPDGTDTNSVKWLVQYVYAKGHNQANYNFGDGTGTSVEMEQAPPGTPFRHMTTEIASPIVNADFEPDGILWIKLNRVSNGGSNNNDGIFVLTVDVHYQSNAIATKNRSPNFYQ